MSPPDDDQGADGAARNTVDSRWWYLVATVPLYYVLASIAGFLVGAAVFVLALTGSAGMMDGMWHAGPGMHTGFFVGGSLLFLGVLGLVLVGMVLSLAFPVAIYLDAEAVERVRSDWQPDPALYGLLGLVGIVAQPLQVALAVYYLYKRHESQGQP